MNHHGCREIGNESFAYYASSCQIWSWEGENDLSHQFSFEKKRAKTAGSGELDCSSEESVVGLLNAININMHPGDKIIPLCITPNKIDDGPEGNVGGVIKETVINDSIFSQTALYRTSKPLIEHLQKSINDLMLIGYGGAKHTEKKWGQKRTEQFILHIFSRIKTLFEISTTVPTSGGWLIA